MITMVEEFLSVLFATISSEQGLAHSMCSVSRCMNLLYALIKICIFFFKCRLLANVYILRLTRSIVSSKEKLSWARAIAQISDQWGSNIGSGVSQLCNIGQVH